jgi:hypothetical protein
MRLLSRTAVDGGFSLTEFHGDVPPNAILSHTWGRDDDEVSYLNLMNDAARSNFAATELLKTVCSISGWTPAASTRQAVQSSLRLLTQCSLGTGMLRNATFI